MFTNINQVEAFFQSRYKLGIKPGLERMDQLLRMQGNPENGMEAIHIAGTNGKGSTIQYIKNALIASGYRVGVFTSPSLEGRNGHIIDNDQVISEKAFISLLNQLYPSIKQLDHKNLHPSEFEILTVLAFMYFSNSVDIALIEAGMGGREDTTNCFTPILSIITNVSKDHTAFLGNTIEQITYHKAGIIKQNVPVIIGNVSDQSFNIIKNEAAHNNASIYQLNKHFFYRDREIKENAQYYIWIDENNQQLSVVLHMEGMHQVQNASMAIMALKLLSTTKFVINWNDALEAIKTTKVPGRFETIYSDPTIIIDGAHNLAGIESFLHTVSYHERKKKKHLIFAGFKDKDLEQMIDQCIPYFDSITITSFDHPRAASILELQKVIESSKIIKEPNWEALMENILDQNGGIYYITGSLHFIAKVRKYFETY
ncbi:bifunctional folylpolyglutamate synthase/dihydrofolate synthase [Ornithinibacillus salinisoli]|uniref:tetrahydrofolate synthase n=1 Tax=Ornithinibacillus salinisoli TaxID=1848459 RepID=A0ABW4W367_9BACI